MEAHFFILDIKVTLLSTSQQSLPEDLRLVAEVLVESNAVAKSEALPMDLNSRSWTLKVKSDM